MSIPSRGGKRDEHVHVFQWCSKLRPDAQSRKHSGKTKVLTIDEVSVAKRSARNARHIDVCMCSTPQALAKNRRVTAPHFGNLLASSIARDAGY